MNNFLQKKSFQIYSIVFLFLGYLNSVQAQILNSETAQNIESKASKLGTAAGFASTSLAGVVAVVIQAFLSILGIIFIFLLLYSGYNWMTAAGDQEKIKKAKTTITNSVIGLIIILAAYSITYFVFNRLPFGENGSME